VGGIILARAGSRDAVEDFIKEDPFYINDIATYDITEFLPTKYADSFAVIMDLLDE